MLKDRTDRLLLATALALGLFVALRLAEQAALPPDRIELPAVEPRDVVEILVGAPDEQTHLRRAAAGFELLGPDGPPERADDRKVEALLRYFSVPRASGPAVSAGSDRPTLDRLGFGPATVVDLELIDARGRRLLSIELGNPTRGGRLLRRDRDRGAYVLMAPGLDGVLRPEGGWRAGPD